MVTELTTTQTTDPIQNDPLTDARLARGWTQRKLAAESGLSLSTIGNIELGRHPASRASRRLLSLALGLDESALFPQG